MQASDQGARTQVPRRTRVKGKPCIYRNTTEDGRTRYQFTYVDSAGQATMADRRRRPARSRSRPRRHARQAPPRRAGRQHVALPLSDLVEAWLATQTHLRPSTTEGYERALIHQILPRLGRLRVSQIYEDDIARLIREMEAAGYAAWTIRGTLTPLRRSSNTPADEGIITSNPFDRLERGERPRLSTTKELRVLNRDEIEALLQAASPRYRVALATAIFTGLRRGELLGLRWCDVDLQAGSVTVRYQLDRRSHKLVEPKTANARRTVALPRFLTQLLAEHRLASPYSQDTDYVFSTSQGTPMDARNFVPPKPHQRPEARSPRGARPDRDPLP